MGTNSEELTSGAIVDLMLAIEGLYKSGGEGFALEGVVDATGAQIIGDSLMQTAINCAKEWYSDLYNREDKKEADSRVRKFLTEDEEIQRILTENNVNPVEFMVETGYFTTSMETASPEMVAEINDIVKAIGSQGEGATKLNDYLYQQINEGNVDELLKLSLNQEAIVPNDKFKYSTTNELLTASISGALNKAFVEGNEEVREIYSNFSSAEAYENAEKDGFKVKDWNEDGKIEAEDIDMQMREWFDSGYENPIILYSSSKTGSVAGFARHNATLDTNNYILNNGEQPYILIPSSNTSSIRVTDNGTTMTPFTIALSRGKMTTYPHEYAHTGQFGTLYEEMQEGGAFDTDDCFSSAKCKGLAWEYSYTKQPVVSGKYQEAYRASPMEYYVYGIGDNVGKNPINNMYNIPMPSDSKIPRVPRNQPVVRLPIK